MAYLAEFKASINELLLAVVDNTGHRCYQLISNAVSIRISVKGRKRNLIPTLKCDDNSYVLIHNGYNHILLPCLPIYDSFPSNYVFQFKWSNHCVSASQKKGWMPEWEERWCQFCTNPAAACHPYYIPVYVYCSANVKPGAAYNNRNHYPYSAHSPRSLLYRGYFVMIIFPCCTVHAMLIGANRLQIIILSSLPFLT